MVYGMEFQIWPRTLGKCKKFCFFWKKFALCVRLQSLAIIDIQPNSSLSMGSLLCCCPICCCPICCCWGLIMPCCCCCCSIWKIMLKNVFIRQKSKVMVTICLTCLSPGPCGCMTPLGPICMAPGGGCCCPGCWPIMPGCMELSGSCCPSICCHCCCCWGWLEPARNNLAPFFGWRSLFKERASKTS